MSTPTEESSPGNAGPSSLRWWTGGRGLAGVAQWPNPAIALWMLTLVLRWTHVADGVVSKSTLAGIGVGALLVWALDELLRGISPVRRLMGIVVLIAELAHLMA